MPFVRFIYKNCVVGNHELTPAAIAIVRRAEPLITPFLEETDPEFICDWNGVRTTVFLASTPSESPSKDKGKASGPSSIKLKVPLPAVSPRSAHLSSEDDDDVERLLELVKRCTTITPHHPIAPPSSQPSAGPGKKGAKPPVEHEPFDVAKHQYWLTSVSLLP
jgi:hypothetical protein